jgi:hypothetical protein
LLDGCRIGHPAAIDNEADPAKPGHASRIGDGTADSRRLPVPNIVFLRVRVMEGHPAAIVDQADPAKPGYACRIGDGAADSRHLRVPNIALSCAATR